MHDRGRADGPTNMPTTKDVFIMIRRLKTTIFLDVAEDTSVLELKRMVAGIFKIAPSDQRLIFGEQEMKNEHTVRHYGLTMGTAKPQDPPTIALLYPSDVGVQITPLSEPPALPDIMRPEANNNDQ